MPKTFFTLLLILTFGFASYAEKSPKKLSRAEVFFKALDHLRGSEFSTDYEKKIHDLMDRNIESSGEMFFSKGKMRIEQEKPEKTLLVYDGSVAWQEQTFDDGNSKKPYVSKIKNVQKSSALLAALLGSENVLKNFSLKRPVKNGKGRFDLVPKNPKINEVKKLRIDFDDADLKLISYTDNLDNQVTFTFRHFREKSISEKKFKYEPPKDAVVTEV
jgi:outer membrane lipoprotein carrier protein